MKNIPRTLGVKCSVMEDPTLINFLLCCNGKMELSLDYMPNTSHRNIVELVLMIVSTCFGSMTFFFLPDLLPKI
jgi:hypothetical protein